MVTAKHYARWASGERYRPPPALGEDEGLAALLTSVLHCPRKWGKL